MLPATSETPRIALDKLTTWRLKEIGRQEHRSLSNAARVLIEEAFQARLVAATAAALPKKHRIDTATVGA